MCSNYAIRENSKRSSRALFRRDIYPVLLQRLSSRMRLGEERGWEGSEGWGTKNRRGWKTGREGRGRGGWMERRGEGWKGRETGAGGSREGAQGMGHAGEPGGKELGHQQCKQRPATWRGGGGGRLRERTPEGRVGGTNAAGENT